MRIGEDEITAWFAGQSELPGEDYPIGIGDDMAEMRLGEGVTVLVTTDILLEGVHFDLSRTGLEQVGYKAMAVSLSDCAAMATVPAGAVVSVGLAAGSSERELKELHAGLIRAAKRYDCPLIGGDITRWKSQQGLCISSTVISRRGGTEPIRRNGARIGDIICVTGRLGGSGAGRHLEFEPRVREALELAAMVKLNSMMDVSDGLSSDLPRICRASGVGAEIEAELIPLSDEAKKSERPLEAGLNDGEDFELLFTLGESDWARLRKLWRGELEISRIGRIIEADKVRIKAADGKLRELQAKGYEHLG